MLSYDYGDMTVKISHLFIYYLFFVDLKANFHCYVILIIYITVY
jgi:hypothetical protein